MNCIEQSSVCLNSILPMFAKHKPSKLMAFFVLYCNDVFLSPSSITPNRLDTDDNLCQMLMLCSGDQDK